MPIVKANQKLIDILSDISKSGGEIEITDYCYHIKNVSGNGKVFLYCILVQEKDNEFEEQDVGKEFIFVNVNGEEWETDTYDEFLSHLKQYGIKFGKYKNSCK
jgi:hypothetical protein